MGCHAAFMPAVLAFRCCFLAARPFSTPTFNSSNRAYQQTNGATDHEENLRQLHILVFLDAVRTGSADDIWRMILGLNKMMSTKE
jgi:hypothetical protein